jgi:AraC-like DNA-binding protein
VDEYLTKPFNVEELRLRIESLLAIRNILKNKKNQKAAKSPHIEQSLLDKLIDAASIEQISKQDIFIEKLNEVLEKKYTDTSTTVNTVAKAMAMSERQLFRKLKSILGATPTDYLRRFRLEKACLLLAQGQSAINTTFDTGFSSQSYFSKCFKSEYGCTPSDFQKQLLVKNEEGL